MSLGLDQLGLEAHGGQVVADQHGGPPGVGVVVGLGADARNPEQGLELLLEIAPMGLQVGVHARMPIVRHLSWVLAEHVGQGSSVSAIGQLPRRNRRASV